MTALVHVFVGPSLPPSARPSLDWVAWHEPASQGDVYAVTASRPLAVAIIDGYFERVPAVLHQELLWAMSEGVHVLGASSMGALRAAELADFGMLGIGRVFDDFASGRLQDDDEVTIIHADASADFRPASEAMVNIRATLAQAFDEGLLASEATRSLTAYAKSLFYPDRTYARLLAWAKAHLTSAENEAFKAWLTSKANRIDLKRRDALELLRVLGGLVQERPGPKQVPWSFHHTDAWEQLRRTASSRSTAASTPTIAPS